MAEPGRGGAPQTASRRHSGACRGDAEHACSNSRRCARRQSALVETKPAALRAKRASSGRGNSTGMMSRRGRSRGSRLAASSATPRRARRCVASPRSERTARRWVSWRALGRTSGRRFGTRIRSASSNRVSAGARHRRDLLQSAAAAYVEAFCAAPGEYYPGSQCADLGAAVGARHRPARAGCRSQLVAAGVGWTAGGSGRAHARTIGRSPPEPSSH